MASEKAIKTRQSILEAARALICEEGLAALTMDRAAQKAGISKGACMYHFKSKRQLQAALIEEYAEHLHEQLSRHEALFKGRPDETLVPGYVAWFQSFSEDSHGWAQVGSTLLSNFSHDEELMRPVRSWYQRLFMRIEALPEEERIPSLIAVMALEGFFYNHKFGLDLIAPNVKKDAWQYMTNTLVSTGRRKV
ncbi:MAG: TetR/AcrR family transcriptional regulator [Duodenibacillus sp.]